MKGSMSSTDRSDSDLNSGKVHLNRRRLLNGGLSAAAVSTLWRLWLMVGLGGWCRRGGECCYWSP